jgi:hypothetical protein
MQYTRRLVGLRACRRYIAGHECQRRKVGYGPGIVLEKARGVMIGIGGLYDDPFDVGWGTEVGYTFAEAAWGNGYATELVKFSLQFAYERLRSLKSRRSPILTMPRPTECLKRRVSNTNASCQR